MNNKVNAKQATSYIVGGFLLALFVCWQTLDLFSETKVFQSRFCHCSNKPPETHVEYLYDTISRQIISPAPAPIHSIRIDTVTMVDTVTVIQEYYTQNTYKHLMEDSNIVITVYDTIYMNQIHGREIQYSWKQPVEIHTAKRDPGFVLTSSAIISRQPGLMLQGGYRWNNSLLQGGFSISGHPGFVTSYSVLF